MKFEAFETEGGKLAVLVGMIFFLAALAAVMHIAGKDPGETGRTLLAQAFTGLMAILLAKLGKNGRTITK